MRVRTVALAILVSLAGAPPVGAVPMSLDGDGMAVVDGARTFILGLYENPADDAVLNEAVASGVNLVRSESTQAALDRLAAAGCWAWLTTGYAIDLSEDRAARGEQLAHMVDNFARHPALIVWEVPDEALWNVWHLAQGWRHNEEPRQLRAQIAQLADADAVESLLAELDRVGALYRAGRYAEGESRADALWIALGLDIPKPGYGLSTAPARARKMGDGMRTGYETLRALDPAHPIWMNHAPRNSLADLAFFNQAADIVGCDIYPVPEDLHVKHSDLDNRTISSVGAYTARMQAAAGGKPVWMVLQGTGWGDFLEAREGVEPLRRPTREETRYMAYDAIVHGARGLLYWGTHYVEKESAFWGELMDVLAELDRLQPVLAAADAPIQPQVSLAPTYGSVEEGIKVLAKSRPEGDWLIVVNTWSGPLTATLGNLNGTAVAYRIVGSETDYPVKGAQITLSMPRYSVQVLEPIPAN